MTTEQITKALRCCAFGPECEECPLNEEIDCVDALNVRAAAAIEALAELPEQLKKDAEWKDLVIDLAHRKLAKAEAERDAAIVDLKIFAGCATCKHYCNHRRDHQESLLLTCCDCAKKQNCKCGSCGLGRSNWEWRGLPEAPEEGEKRCRL